MRTLAHAFLQSECDEAEVRTALGDAAPLYRDAPEADAARATGSKVIRQFMAEVLPDADGASVTVAADLIEATLTQVGSAFSDVPRSDAEISVFADAMADMFCAYLERLMRGTGGSAQIR